MWVFNGLPPRSMDRIPIEGSMGDVFYNPLSNQVYCAAGNVYVIDGTAKVIVDSFQASMSVGVGQPAFALNPTANRIYALDDGHSRVLAIADTFHVGLQDVTAAPGGRTRLPQTIISKTLNIPGREAWTLLDISGRKVLDLNPGPNDVRALAPGVYFVRECSAVGGERSAASVRKVVLTR
jgi:DNA-binding beta-propeller fold protein YncE